MCKSNGSNWTRILSPSCLPETNSDTQTVVTISFPEVVLYRAIRISAEGKVCEAFSRKQAAVHVNEIVFVVAADVLKVKEPAVNHVREVPGRHKMPEISIRSHDMVTIHKCSDGDFA